MATNFLELVVHSIVFHYNVTFVMAKMHDWGGGSEETFDSRLC